MQEPIQRRGIIAYHILLLWLRGEIALWLWQDTPAQSTTFPENIEQNISNFCSLRNHSRLSPWSDLVSDMWGNFFGNSKDCPVDSRGLAITLKFHKSAHAWRANYGMLYMLKRKQNKTLCSHKCKNWARTCALKNAESGQSTSVVRQRFARPDLTIYAARSCAASSAHDDASAASITCCKALGKPRNRAQRWPKKRDQSQIKCACSRQLGWRGLKDRLTTTPWACLSMREVEPEEWVKKTIFFWLYCHVPNLNVI